MKPLRRLQDISSRRLQDISSRRLQNMSWRRLQDIFSVTIFRLPRCLEDVFKTSSRCYEDVLEDVKLLRWRRVKDVFKTYLQDVFKTSSRPTNVCWVITTLINFCFKKLISLSRTKPKSKKRIVKVPMGCNIVNK